MGTGGAWHEDKRRDQDALSRSADLGDRDLGNKRGKEQSDCLRRNTCTHLYSITDASAFCLSTGDADEPISCEAMRRPRGSRRRRAGPPGCRVHPGRSWPRSAWSRSLCESWSGWPKTGWPSECGRRPVRGEWRGGRGARGRALRLPRRWCLRSSRPSGVRRGRWDPVTARVIM
jgi:hypothetical protein